YALPSGCRKRQVKSCRVRRCLANIPISSWPNSAMTRLRSPHFGKAASSRLAASLRRDLRQPVPVEGDAMAGPRRRQGHAVFEHERLLDIAVEPEAVRLQ